jgi:putative FmdB family regulatory protein
MPIYEYRCQKCGIVFEKIQITKEGEEPLKCPTCGADSPERVLSGFSSSKSSESSTSCGSGGGSSRFS